MQPFGTGLLSYYSKKMKILKLFSITLLCVVVIMILLNPSYDSFQEFATDYKNKTRVIVDSRVHNYLIFSVYEKKILNFEDDPDNPKVEDDKRYVGIFLNFFDVTDKPIPVIASVSKQEDVPIKVDTSMFIDTTKVLKYTTDGLPILRNSKPIKDYSETSDGLPILKERNTK
jgi:hypothetical protein